MSYTFEDLKNIKEREIIEGYYGKFVHANSMTVANLDIFHPTRKEYNND